MFPISLNLGFNFFPFYEGFYFLVAIVAAALWAYRRWKAEGLDQDSFDAVIIGVLVGAVVGGRISHFLFWDASMLVSDPLSLLRVWEGGISVSGGLVGGALGALIACRAKKVGAWSVFAAASPAVLLGQALGRVGCFMNGDAFGLPTSLPWGVSFRRFATVIPSFSVDRTYSGFAWAWCAQRGLVGPDSTASVPMHPTQLYEGGLDLMLLGLLLILMKRADATRRGKLGLLALASGYSTIRFGLEFIRGDHDGTALWGMTAFQLVLLAVAIAGAVAAPFLLREKKEA